MSEFLENKEFKKIMRKAIKESLEFIIKNVDEFSLIIYKNGIEFHPKLPQELKFNNEILLFDIANYTLGTFEVDENFCYFEAGFGEENFVSSLKISLNAIMQIIVDENLVFTNLTKPEERKNVFSLNPNNSKFLR